MTHRLLIPLQYCFSLRLLQKNASKMLSAEALMFEYSVDPDQTAVLSGFTLFASEMFKIFQQTISGQYLVTISSRKAKNG